MASQVKGNPEKAIENAIRKPGKRDDKYDSEAALQSRAEPHSLGIRYLPFAVLFTAAIATSLILERGEL